MLAVVLALAAAIGYGGSDFAAGLASRSAPVIQITLLASWFNYINRVADSLGVGRDASPRVGER